MPHGILCKWCGRSESNHYDTQENKHLVKMPPAELANMSSALRTGNEVCTEYTPHVNEGEIVCICRKRNEISGKVWCDGYCKNIEPALENLLHHGWIDKKTGFSTSEGPPDKAMH